jgi:hypothetical protein
MSPPSSRPSRQEVERAKSLLVDDLFVDFPFEAPSSRAHAIALLVTPFVREIIDGLVPMVAVIAPTVGSGKTKLANAISLVVTGDDITVMSLELGREEMEKRITPLLLEAAPYGMFDNAVGKIDHPALAAVLTTKMWTGRVLGQSKIVKLPTSAVQWIVTGNDLEFTEEIARRSLSIILDAKMDKPFLRTGFKHSPLEAWITQSRPQLVSAILTLIQNWIAKGRPEFNARSLGSFEAYCQIVGGILMAAGLDDGFLQPTLTERPSSFNTVRTAPKDADEDLRRLVKEWYVQFDVNPVLTAKLADYAPRGFCTTPGAPLDQAKDKVSALGRFLSKSVGRTISPSGPVGPSVRIETVPIRDEEHRTRNGWRLVDVKNES